MQSKLRVANCKVRFKCLAKSNCNNVISQLAQMAFHDCMQRKHLKSHVQAIISLQLYAECKIGRARNTVRFTQSARLCSLFHTRRHFSAINTEPKGSHKLIAECNKSLIPNKTPITRNCFGFRLQTQHQRAHTKRTHIIRSNLWHKQNH